MSREKYMHFIASFMAVLVLTIPFYTTSVYASISKVSAKGADGVEGFAKSDDFVSLSVVASISGDTITNNQVVLGIEPSMQFDKCIQSSDGNFECTLRIPGNGTEEFEPIAIPFTVNLLRDDNSVEDSKSGSLVIDNLAPQVKLYVSKSKFSSAQDVIVNYDATDFACNDASCNNKCAGIKSIEIYTSDSAFRHTMEPAAEECSFNSNVSIDSGTFDSGLNSVFARATDNLNQVSAESSVTFDVDNSGPIIQADSFKISRNGITLSTFPSLGLDVEVAVDISGDDLDKNSVTADLSALNPGNNLKNARAFCSAAEEGISACKWFIELDPGTGGLKTIVTNASDTAGNKESAAISKFISIDGDGPVAESLSTSTEGIGRQSGNTVTAVFAEASGLIPDEVILHVGSRQATATSCDNEAQWVCIWENVNFGSSKSVQLSIDSDTTDIFGNPVAEAQAIEVAVDNREPVLEMLNISNVGGLTQAFAGFSKIGDKIAVVANLTEENDLFAAADFSKFISDAANVVGSCERTEGNEHICTWLTDSINLQASSFITFNFSDNAGNSLIITRGLKTFGLENATVPDFWGSSAVCSPDTIDRQLGTLINQRIFCQVNLKQKTTTKPVSTIFISPASCSGDTSIAENIETFNTEAGSKSPIIKVTLKKDDFRIDNASLSCSFSIFSKIGSGTDITKNPEIENAKINVRFSNLPLGELSSEVQRKIKDAKSDAKGIFKLIGTMNRLVFYAKRICQIFGIIYNTISLIYTVANLWGAISDTTCFTLGGFIQPICPVVYKEKVAWCNLQQGARQSAQESFSLTGNTFCKLVNCQMTFLWGPKVQDYINNNFDYLTPGLYVGKQTEATPKDSFFKEVTPKDQKGTTSTIDYPSGKSIGFNRPVSEMMDPQHNLITATLFMCLPGIIYGLDKFRQIQCLYADCLENAVGKEGKPVTACEDLKAFSTCKYIYTELFAVFPWTAVLDHYLSLIKGALSSPFAALGVGISAMCWKFCPEPTSWGFTVCEGTKLFSTMGEVIGNINNIIDEGFKVRQDYCSRLDLEEDKKTEQPAAGSGFTQVKQK